MLKQKIILFLFFLTLSNFSCALADQNKSSNSNIQPQSIEVSPTEDLMREHGVLTRLLLIYEEILRRINNNETYPATALYKTTEIIRSFVQNYHEKLEEQYVFPRFNKNSDLGKLTTTLKQQHNAGRKIIDQILAAEKMQKQDDKTKLITAINAFIKMYRPHKGREDTILFPAFHAIVPAAEYNKLGDMFEDKEQELFGKNGFENIVKEVAEIEKSLGIYNLTKFTPK